MIMDIYSLVECILAGTLFLWGISAICNVKSFQDTVNFFFKEDEQSSVLTFFFAFLLLPWGLAVVFTHNDWVWDFSVIVTLLGWIWTIQASLWLFVPRLMKKVFSPMLPYITNPWFIRIYGVCLIIISKLIFYPYFPEKLLSLL